MLVGKMNPGRDDEDPAGQGAGDALPPHWQAPLANQQLTATVPLPGSKSLTGRELILAALADGPSTLHAPLHSRDTMLMTEALRALDITISAVDHPANAFGPDLRITPAEELIGSTSIECGLAGTVMRFMPAVASLALGPVSFDGDPYARKRPMRPVLEALRTLGADISDDGRGALPFTVHGTGSLKGGRVELDASLSSQFVSGLLLAAAHFEEGVHVVHTGERLPSVPHIEMTLESLRRRGVQAETVAPGEWRVLPGAIRAINLTIEPDLSNAAPFLAAALVAGGTVSVPNWPLETTQVGDQLRSLLPAFGAEVTTSESGDTQTVTVRGTGVLRGATLHVPEAGELAPTLIGLAALAAHGTGNGDGEASTITGIGHIRHHETDRIAALVNEINALGGDAKELEDGIAVQPATLRGGTWGAYADHRMATTGALIGLRVPELEVDDIESTSKTLPQFTELWENMLSDGVS
ncbi:3-phosphoshikimate 1-carboxyvinyltransferase [Leucobacter sp. UT-8R-CII-1-4]|uniref:3-phosphoshikimate 1-carboxyvinyltransferase n=1 Tax=Leucobacter sp. UT-8R-CII-1-4 TaxID=3040075 RepID=UPI0024A966D1|nr:3-phosphoshikimate 1-carboxyvinyltransferase [Leucobacter sp. UT-8R-CII-1-4]MDI6022078.1 3-phosphoshikimate 1-carboxyvinyltransferase [Leucobacter sp. UT-8R-CII-1-4]